MALHRLFHRTIAALLLIGSAQAQVRYNQIYIVAPPTGSGLTSGIDILTNAATPTTGAYIIHGAQAKENARIDSYGNPTIYPGNYCTHSRGTEAAPTAPQTGDVLCIWATGGYDGAAMQAARLRITGEAANNWAAGTTGTTMFFWTTDIGSGTPSKRWRINSNGFFYPDQTNAYSIGSSSLRVLELWVGGVDANNVQFNSTLVPGGSATVTGNLIPTSNNTYDLGSVSVAWQDGYFINVVGSTSGVFGALSGTTVSASTVISHWIPGTTLTYTLGDSTHYWDKLWVEDIAISTGGGVTGHLIPSNGNTYDLGSVGNNWRGVFANTFTGNGQTGGTGSISVRKADDSGSCTITFAGGIFYAGGTC